MLILAVDTSGQNGSIALAQGDSEQFRCLEMVPLAAGAYSAELIPQLSALLRRHELQKVALEGFAVVCGPGSFTGLRVGLSTVKALAEVSGKPIAAVSALEAVAWSAHQEGTVFAALDAGRRQVFVGEYRVDGGNARLIQESVVTLEELLALRRTDPAKPLFTPHQSVLRALNEIGAGGDLIPPPQADVIARIGLGKILMKQTVSPEMLDANYIRRSDAELFSVPRHS